MFPKQPIRAQILGIHLVHEGISILKLCYFGEKGGTLERLAV